MPKPNFFIVGAPKCGTSSLARYLRQHPDVFMSPIKEPRFFASDLDSGSARDGSAFVRSLEDYLALFEGAGPATRIGEASALYLFSQSAASNIRELCPEAKIIAMFRNPVDVLYAFHEERFYYGNEDIEDFSSALAAESDRARGARLPPAGTIPAALQYRAVVRFSTQIERYIDAFGRANVHVIIFDDLKRDTEACYHRVLAFLGLSTTFVPDFTVYNRSKRVRSQRVARFLRQPPPMWDQVARALAPARVRKVVRQRIRRLNTRRGSRPPLDPSIRRELAAEMRPEVQRLSNILERDLVHWVAV